MDIILCVISDKAFLCKEETQSPDTLLCIQTQSSDTFSGGNKQSSDTLVVEATKHSSSCTSFLSEFVQSSGVFLCNETQLSGILSFVVVQSSGIFFRDEARCSCTLFESFSIAAEDESSLMPSPSSRREVEISSRVVNPLVETLGELSSNILPTTTVGVLDEISEMASISEHDCVR